MTTKRPLTPGEIALARSIFKDSIDYASVRIHDGPFLGLQPRHMGMAPNGHIYMHGCFETDYSAGPLHQQSFFIHEMTHVWQYQNKILHPVAAFFDLQMRYRFNYAASYRYTLEPGRDLVDYNMEQQATIVQNYFEKRENGGDLSDYRTVLQKFLDDPAYARRSSFPPPGFSPGR